mmetsp:Transcript_35626/g.68312  ORF Transcript_35626/g.68312 Transcript_35626/m.68312 type:complete len:421 (+) Transcript_35626:136-1398(+)
MKCFRHNLSADSLVWCKSFYYTNSAPDHLLKVCRPLHNVEALNPVAWFELRIAFQLNSTLRVPAHDLYFLPVSPDGRALALVHHSVLLSSENPHLVCQNHPSIFNATPSDNGTVLPSLDVENLHNVCVTHHLLHVPHGSRLLQQLADFIQHVVYHLVRHGAHGFLSCHYFHCCGNGDVEGADDAARSFCESHVRMCHRSHSGEHHLHTHELAAQALERSLHRLRGPVHVRLHHHHQLARPVVLDFEHSFLFLNFFLVVFGHALQLSLQRSLFGRQPGLRALARDELHLVPRIPRHVRSKLAQLSRSLLVGHHRERVSRRRHAPQPADDNWHRRIGRGHGFFGWGAHAPHPPPVAPDHHCLSHAQLAARHQHRGKSPHAHVLVALYYHAFGITVDARLQVQVLRLQLQRVLQLRHALPSHG